MITFEEFSKIEVRVGEIKEVDIVPDADRLLRLMVDVGEESPRQIVSGIRAYFEDPQTLVGKKCAFVTNLEPRTIRGCESNGMIMAAHDEEDAFSLLEVGADIAPGTRVS